MKTIHGMLLKLAVAASGLAAFSAPALATDWRHDRGEYEHRDRYWHDNRFDDRGDVRLRGPGVSDLHPWFRQAKAGREYAARRAGSYIDDREAGVLNREYYDRFGWREARRSRY